MEIIVTFYFREIAPGVRIECASLLSDTVKGYGATEDEAEEDYYKKYNEWSKKITENAKEILDLKGVEYSIKEYHLTHSNQ